MPHKTWVVAFVVVLGACSADVSEPDFAPGRISAAVGGGNSEAAHLCKEQWRTLQRADGTGFRNQGECVSYAAHGGQFNGGGPTPTIVDFFDPNDPESSTLVCNTLIFIEGSGFTGTTAVLFNGVAGTFTVLSDEVIAAGTPANLTPGVITIVGPGGTVTSPPYTVGPCPTT